MEKVLSNKSTSKNAARREFKLRYEELSDELGNYIANIKARLPQNTPECFEFKIGEMIVWTDKKDRTVVDIIRKRKGK